MSETQQTKEIQRFVQRGSIATFLIRVFYLGSGFVTMLLLTRWLGAENLGIYNYVMSWIALAVIFVKFGIENFLIREIASLRGAERWLDIQSVWHSSFWIVTLTSVLAMAIFSVCLCLIPMQQQGLKNTFWLSLMMIPVLAWLGIFRGRFRANKHIVFSQIPESVVRPVFTIVVLGCFLLLAVPSQPEFALLATIGTSLVALVICFVGPKLDCRTQESKLSRLSWSQLLTGAFPFVLIAGIHIINQRTDRLMLGSLKDMESVGYYSVAVQMALIVNFPLLGITASIAPLIAERNADRQLELESTLIRSTLVATLVSILIFAALVVFGKTILPFFGSEFLTSYLPLIILAIGQLANVAAGPVGTILTMSHKEGWVAFAVFFGAILNVILNLILIPSFGIIGAALATAISMIAWNMALVVFAKRELAINASVFSNLVPARKLG